MKNRKIKFAFAVLLMFFASHAYASDLVTEWTSSWGSGIDTQGGQHYAQSLPSNSQADSLFLTTGSFEMYDVQLSVWYTPNPNIPNDSNLNSFYEQQLVCLGGSSSGEYDKCILSSSSDISNTFLYSETSVPNDRIYGYSVASFYAISGCQYDGSDCSAGYGVSAWDLKAIARPLPGSNPPPTTTVTVGFHAHANCSAEDIPGATITDSTSGQTVTTDNNGMGYMDIAQNANITWSASANGYSPNSGTANSGSGTTASVDVLLPRDCASAPPPPPPPPPPPENSGVCVDGATASFISGPANLSPGATGSFTVQVENTGNDKWYNGNAYRFYQTSGYTISSTGATLNGAPYSNVNGVSYGHLPDVMYPGDVVTWTFNVTAPMTTGTKTFTMRMTHLGGQSYLQSDNTACGSPATPGSDTPFGDTASINFTVGNPTVQTGATLTDMAGSAVSTIIPDGSTQYKINVFGTDDAGGSRLQNLDWIINYQGGNIGTYRGAGKWAVTNTYKVNNTPPTYKDNITCDDGTSSAVLWTSTWGPQYIHLISCSYSTSALARVVTYVVNFTNLFTTPTSGNDISSFAQDTPTSVNTGWINNDLNFGLAAASTLSTSATISSSSVNPNGSAQYTISVSGNDSQGASRVNKADWIINYQGTNGDGTQTKARGAGKWKPDNTYAVYTSPYKGGRTCTYNGSVSSSGGSAVIWNTYGVGYIYSLVSCNVVDSGNVRRVDYVVKFDPSFTSPTTLNDISTDISDSITGTDTGWVNSDLNFGLIFDAPTVTYTCGSPASSSCTVSSGDTLPINWSSSNATTCDIDGTSVPANTPGSFTSPPITVSASSTFTCTGPGGTSSATVTVTVSGGTNTLTVTTNPGPGGYVTSSTGGINCGSVCSASYTTGTVVSLTATPSSSYWKFNGWSGDCTGSALCVLSIDGSKAVTATFIKRIFNYNEF